MEVFSISTISKRTIHKHDMRFYIFLLFVKNDYILFRSNKLQEFWINLLEELIYVLLNFSVLVAQRTRGFHICGLAIGTS